MLRNLPLFTLLFFLGVATPTTAQKAAKVKAPNVVFGQITPADVNVALTAEDSAAEAVVLYDAAKVGFLDQSNYVIEMACHQRIKILKKSAYDRATITLPLRKTSTDGGEQVLNIEGFTYNVEDGHIVRTALDKSGIVFENATGQVMLQKFTLPAVREGSVLEFRYVLHKPFSVGYNPPTWNFQRDIPVRWSDYKILIPGYFQYKIMFGGYLPLAIEESSRSSSAAVLGQSATDVLSYHFAVQNAPALREEPFITSLKNYQSRIEFELARAQTPGSPVRTFSLAWNDLDRTLLAESNFAGQYRRAGFLREVAQTIRTAHPADSVARLRAAYDGLRRRVKWDERGNIYADNVEKVYNKQQGDAADINLLLLALLRELDFDANPVILPTRDFGRASQEYALLRQYNYVVAHVNVGGREWLLDATDPYLPMGMLPTRCLNGTGRLIHPKHSRSVSLAPTERQITAHMAQFTLTAEGNVTGTLTTTDGGYAGWKERSDFKTQGETKYIEKRRKEHPGWQIGSVTFQNVDSLDNVFTTQYKLDIAEAASATGDQIYFRPMLTEGVGVNPFKTPDRQYPVDFGAAIDETFTATFKLPDGYVVDELPKPAGISLPEGGGRFLYQVTANGNEVQVVSRLSLRKPVYLAEEYAALRQLYDRIVQKHGELVVLKRGSMQAQKP